MYLQELGVPISRSGYRYEMTSRYAQPSNKLPSKNASLCNRISQCCSFKAMRAALDFWWLFMETSSIHGFNHLTTKKRNFWEYVLWFACLCMSLGCAISVSLFTWQRYQDNPTVISMERDFHEWNTSFPAVTICPTYKYDSISINNFVEKLQNLEDKEAMEIFLQNLAGTTYETFSNMTHPPSNVVPPDNYQKAVFQNRFIFNYTVVNSVDTEKTEVVRHLSEMGICYTYNTKVAPYNSPDVWDGSKKIVEPMVVISGNSLDGDLFSQIMDMNSPSHASRVSSSLIHVPSCVYVHSTEEIPDAATPKLMLPDKNFKTLELSALSIYTSEEARLLTVHQRKCRFLEESNLVISPIYTYNMCRMECRMMQAFKLCQCVPYFYRHVNEKQKVCDTNGMHCLAKYEDHLIKLLESNSSDSEQKVKCNCLSTCEGVNYVIEIQNDMPWFLGTNLKWSMSKYPQMRLKRDVLFGFTDVLVSIGGTAGFFLGCSLLSFIEVFYFFTLRLFWFVLHNTYMKTT